MKQIYFLLILTSLVITNLNNQALGRVYQDPFYSKEKIDCEKQSLQLLMVLQNWQLNGIIQLDDNAYQTIWLSFKDQWLTVSMDSIPDKLLPWQIKQITLNRVIWNAHLTDDCDRFISWTMQLHEKE